MTSRTGVSTGTCSALISRAPLGMLGLPHPLLGDDVDFELVRRVARRRGRQPPTNHQKMKIARNMVRGGPADLDLAAQHLRQRPARRRRAPAIADRQRPRAGRTERGRSPPRCASTETEGDIDLTRVPRRLGQRQPDTRSSRSSSRRADQQQDGAAQKNDRQGGGDLQQGVDPQRVNRRSPGRSRSRAGAPGRRGRLGAGAASSSPISTVVSGEGRQHGRGRRRRRR